VTQPKRPLRRRIHGVMFKLPMMISCSEFEDFILAYLDDDLPPSKKFLFESHLKLCRECRAYLKAYRASVSLTEAQKEISAEDVPEDLVKAILAARDA